MILKFSNTRTEFELGAAIAKRAVALADRLGLHYPHHVAVMDIDVCHANGCPLDLAGLLNASPADFAHDVLGIRRHLNRETGELGGCFVPRYALPVTA